MSIFHGCGVEENVVAATDNRRKTGATRNLRKSASFLDVKRLDKRRPYGRQWLDMFDPYRKWLGIPETDRPPTHYQLLGIAPHERDREVIEGASLRQSAYVRNFQKGAHGEHATRLLNEISAARVCLLDPAKARNTMLACRPRLRRPSPMRSRPAASLPARARAAVPCRSGR